jgi:hypothetical protein
VRSNAALIAFGGGCCEIAAASLRSSKIANSDVRASTPHRAVFFLHGGGYLCGSARSHREIANILTLGDTQSFDDFGTFLS